MKSYDVALSWISSKYANKLANLTPEVRHQTPAQKASELLRKRLKEIQASEPELVTGLYARYL